MSTAPLDASEVPAVLLQLCGFLRVIADGTVPTPAPCQREAEELSTKLGDYIADDQREERARRDSYAAVLEQWRGMFDEELRDVVERVIRERGGALPHPLAERMIDALRELGRQTVGRFESGGC